MIRKKKSPFFSSISVSLAKALKIGELRRISDQSQKLAFLEFGRLMHEGSPRASFVTNCSISGIQRNDLIRCRDRFYRPERVMISISGDIGRKEAEAIYGISI